MTFLLWLSGFRTQLVYMRMRVPSLASLCGLRIHCCHELLYRLAAAALIQPLAWELPYAMGASLKRQKKKKQWESFQGWMLSPCLVYIHSIFQDNGNWSHRFKYHPETSPTKCQPLLPGTRNANQETIIYYFKGKKS